MSREKLLLVLAGALIAIVLLVPLGALAFIKSGIYDTGASSPHTKLTTWITHETMIHSVRRHSARVEAPRAFTAAQVAAGFCRYQAHCVACHGASGVARQQWVSGLEPAPPYLLDVRKDFTRPQLFWTVKNGIKMTGMPRGETRCATRRSGTSSRSWTRCRRWIPSNIALGAQPDCAALAGHGSARPDSEACVGPPLCQSGGEEPARGRRWFES